MARKKSERIKSGRGSLPSSSLRPEEPAQPKKQYGNLPLYILLVVCLSFLTIIYFNAKMDDRQDRLQAELTMLNNNLAAFKAVDNSFCYGYDEQGQKIVAVDERKILTACRGFEDVKQ